MLSLGGYVTNVLFLADRTALVKQAKNDFKKYLPDQLLCSLCSSKDDKARYEDDFAEDDTLPTFIPPEKLNKFIFNANTVDTVLQDLMERGIKTAGGDYIGNAIIFVQNIPLSRGDYTELEHIFTCELGSKEDYAREFKDTPSAEATSSTRKFATSVSEEDLSEEKPPS